MEVNAPIHVTVESFQTDVIDKSQSMPVVVLFWAEQIPLSVQGRALLEQLLAEYQGKFVLALSDVAIDQNLAQRLQVQGLPSIRIIHLGQMAEQIDGPADETQLRTILDGLTESAADAIKGDLDSMLASGDFAGAAAVLQESIQEEPKNQSLRVELADVLVRKGDLDDARTVLSSIPDGTADRERPQNRLEFVEEVAAMDTLEALEQAIGNAPDDLETRYQLAIHLIVAERYEEGLDSCMEILRGDREFREDIGRLTMIRVFNMLGKGNEIAGKYRRKMFNLMH
ncbi:MAG: tetratricopeptide repeat protein [Pseudomonadales bacterium]|jgi:putative thioredoxin|nr:tetratricopeptide repeat protein [Pseudomonadales bacterium]